MEFLKKRGLTVGAGVPKFSFFGMKKDTLMDVKTAAK